MQLTSDSIFDHDQSWMLLPWSFYCELNGENSDRRQMSTVFLFGQDMILLANNQLYETKSNVWPKEEETKMITLSQVEHNYGLEPVLKDFSMVVHHGEKVGLIGPNGAGKSTIFKLITGEEVPVTGTVAIGRHLRVGYLRQIPKRDDDETVETRLWKGTGHLLSTEQRLRELEALMAAKSDEDDGTLQRYVDEYGLLSVQFEHAGGYTYESRMKQILQGLGFNVPLTSQVRFLSGGELSRLELAVLLLQEPEILLLDEPTNHLDFSAINWLEQFLTDYTGTVVVISHDRYFLDRTVQRIFEVKHGQAEEYPGNYSFYLTERERRYEIAQKDYLNQQKEIKRKEEAIKRLRQWASNADNEMLFKRAASMQKQLDKLERIDRPTLNDTQFKLRFDAERSGKEVVTLKGVQKAFGQSVLFDGVDLQLFYGKCTGIVGPNGTGKTTLLKMILNQLAPDAGEVKVGANVQIGYFDQHQEMAHEEKTLLEAFLADAPPMPEVRARGVLATYGFTGERVFTRVKDLSGGERSRLLLLQMVFTQVNLLILDEPTNHFDLPSVEVLEDALREFPGTLLVISHDRYFLNRVVDEIYAIEHGQLVYYPGNYEDYRRKVEAREHDLEMNGGLARVTSKVGGKSPDTFRGKSTDKPGKPLEKSQARSDSRLTAEREEKKRRERLTKELAKVEIEIANLESMIVEAHKLMTEQDYLDNFLRLQELQANCEANEAKIAELMQKWEELSLQLH